MPLNQKLKGKEYEPVCPESARITPGTAVTPVVAAI